MYYLSKKEEKIIDDFYSYVHIDKEHMKEIYRMKWKNGTEILVVYCTDSDDYNGLEPDDPDYEEYTSFIMDLKRIDNFDVRDEINLDEIKKYKTIIINYHNFPDEIYNSKGELISKKKD